MSYVQEQLVTDIKYQKEKGEVVVTQTKIKNFFGDDALTDSEAEITAVVVGSDCSFYSTLAGYTFYKIVYGSVKVNQINTKECYTEIGITGWGILDSQAPCKDLRITIGKCISDKIIHKIPLGSTVVIDLGKHFKEVRLLGEATSRGDAEARIDTFCGTNPILQAYITEDCVENKFIYESAHIEECAP